MPRTAGSRASSWAAALQMLLTALFAVFDPGAGAAWAVRPRPVEECLEELRALSDKFAFRPKPTPDEWTLLCKGQEMREPPAPVQPSVCPVYVVGDSTISTRSNRSNSQLGLWKQFYHWAIEISAHEGKGYADLARALRTGPPNTLEPPRSRRCRFLEFEQLNDG
jgi:hypothetical protein